MKKFAKILTVLLTVCLLAGVVTATVASADGTSMIDTIGADKNNGLADTVASRHTAASINTYTRYTRNSDSNTAAETTSFTFASGANYDQYKYVVFDLDFMSDAYSTGTTLAYMNKIRFTWSQNTNGKCYILNDNDDWYACNKNSLGATGAVCIPLEKELGVWNHLTQVVDIVNNLSYIFINGQFLSCTTNKASTSVDTSNFNLVVDKNLTGNFSIGIDNVIARGYAANYVAGENIGYSITDYFGAETVNTSNPIYMCDDMVYNSAYKFDSVSNNQAIAIVNGNEHHVSLDTAIDELKNESGDVTLVTRKSIEGFEIPNAIDKLTVTCKDGAKFSYMGAYNTTSETTEGTTTYYVIEKASDSITVTWFNINGEIITNTEVVAGNAVQIPESVANAYATIKGTAKYEYSTDGSSYNEEFLPGSTVVSAAIYVRPVTATVTWMGVEGIDGAENNVSEIWYKGSVLDAGDLTRFSSYKIDDGNGWYVIKYNAWTDFTKDMTVEEDEYTFRPELAPVAAVKYKANITLFDQYTLNIYVAKPTDAKISVTKVGELTDGQLTGNYYVNSSPNQDYRALENAYSIEIEFDVEYNNSRVSLKATASVTTKDYIQKALDDATTSSDKVAEKLIVSFANYLYNCRKYEDARDSELSTYCSTLVQEHAGCCLNTEIPDAANESNNASLGCLIFYKPYISSEMVKYVYFGLCVPNELGVDKNEVKATFNGIKDNKTNQDVTVDFVTEGSSIYSALVQGENTTAYDVYISTEYAIYNLLETMTITVGDNTIEFNIVDYISYLKTNNASEKDIALMESLYRFAEAAKEFKMVGATLVEQ